jgi:putative peptidoglycan lipid II flippase
LFERKAFDSQSVILTSRALIGYLPGILFLSAVIILQRLFYATKNTTTPLVISTFSFIVSIPFYKILSDLWGITGISAATSVFSIIAVILIVWRWYKFYPQSKLLFAFKPVLITILVAVFVVGIEFFVMKFVDNFKFARILRICIVSFPAIIFSIVVLNGFGIIKIGDLLKKIVRLRKRLSERQHKI